MLDHEAGATHTKSPTAPSLTGAAFLREYFRGTQGRIYLGVIRNAGSKLSRGEIAHLITRNSAEVAKFISEYDKPEHECAVYYTTSTLKSGATKRTAANCSHFPSIFADCDDHNHDLDRARVIALLEAAECPPTLIVDSGHGLQPHWLLSEPSDDANRIIAARKKLHALTASDAVHDAPRYMRLPGTHNSKHGDWLLVEVVSYHPERRYALEVIEEWLDRATTIIPRKVKATKGNGKAAHNDIPFTVPPSTGPGTDHRRGAAWAQAALAASARELANAGEGSRHATLLKKANRMGTMIARGWIDMVEVRRVLFAAAETNGQIKDYGVEHFEETFADGIKHGTAMPHSDLPNDDPPRGDDAHHARQDEPPPPHGSEDYEPKSDAPPRQTIKWLDMSNWDHEPRPEREWAILNRVPLNQAGLFSGEGGAGKSIIEMMKDVAHVAGKDWLGSLPLLGPAWYIGAEDDEKEIHIRFHDICAHYGVTFKELIDGGLRVLCLLGQDATLCAVGKSGRIETTALYHQLYEAAGDLKPKNISIDTLSRAFAGNEIDRVQVYAFAMHMQALAMVARGSVTVLSHPSLQGIASGSGISGSTAWHGAFRFRQYLKGIKPTDGEQPDNDLREIEFKKNQYGPMGETITLRYQRGLFLPVAAMGSLNKMAADQAAENLFLELLDKFQAQGRNVSHSKTAHAYAPTMFAKDPKAKAPGIRNTLADAMERLFTAKKIKVENYGRPSNPHTRLTRCTDGKEEKTTK